MVPQQVAQDERLLTNPDVDAAREFFRHKSRALVPRVMTAKEATARFVHDGDYLAVGGFGTNRIPTAILHEIVRQGRKHLGFAGHTTTHDFQILAAGELLRPLRRRLHRRPGGARPVAQRPPASWRAAR